MNWLRTLFERSTHERLLDAELQFHLEQQIRDFMDSGMSEPEARRKALLSLGNVLLIREDVRQAHGGMWLDRLTQDLRYAARVLAHAPAFTIVALLTLAIGIGAATAVFSQVNAVFFKSLPVKNPEELRTLSWTSPKRSFTASFGPGWDARLGAGEAIETFSYPAFLRMRDGTTRFSDLACWQDPGENRPVVIEEWGRVQAQVVSGNYFRAVGANAILGRTLTPDDDRAEVTEMAAVVSWGLWQRAFRANPDVLNRKVTINGIRFAIVGVLPQDFAGLNMLYAPEVLLPMASMPPPGYMDGSNWTTCQIVGRLHAGVSDEQARAEAETLVRQVILANPPKELYELPRVWIAKTGYGNDPLRHIVSKALLVLLSAAAVILLIACANIAGLLVARSAFRQKEIATRLALGASRVRLVRQLLTECLLLSLSGGILGIGLAYALDRFVPNVLGQFIPSAFGTIRELGVSSGPDWNVLGFALVLAVVTALLFGLVPALGAARIDLVSMMKSGNGQRRMARFRFTNGKTLVAVQVTLSILLLIGAGLFVRTVINLKSEPLGFDPEGLVMFRVEPRLSGYTPARRQDFFENALKRLNNVPGVTAASGSVIPLLANVNGAATICVPGFTPKDPADNIAGFNSVAPRYFETMRMRLLQGRDVEWSDREGNPNVILVNETFAKKYFPGKNPIGQQLGGPGCPGNNPSLSVVGVVADSRSRPREDVRATFYPSYRQRPTNIWMTFVVRTAREPSRLASTIRRVFSELDPNVPILEMVQPVEMRERLMTRERLLAALLILFGGIAAFVSVLGVYGLLAYTVNWRAAEIGVRMALGASRPDVIWMIVRESVGPVAFGLALGLCGALLLTRFIESLLFGVSRNDPWTIAGVILLFLIAAAIGTFFPARRAARLDPVKSLRHE